MLPETKEITKFVKPGKGQDPIKHHMKMADYHEIKAVNARNSYLSGRDGHRSNNNKTLEKHKENYLLHSKLAEKHANAAEWGK